MSRDLFRFTTEKPVSGEKIYRSLEIDQFLITSHFCCETFQSHDGNVIEIDGFNKKSGSYILECSNIEHKDETIQAKVTCFVYHIQKN